MHIGIIGSAGRGEDGAKWTKAVYNKAYSRLISILAQVANGEIWSVHSGGAAWADHLAVSLARSNQIDASKLNLHIPCPFMINGSEMLGGTKGPIPGFYDTGERDHLTNPGGTLNYYHRLFSEKMGGNTLNGIKAAIEAGVIVHDQYFHKRGNRLLERNKGIGRGLDVLIAFTWGEGDIPKDGGTKHCWDHSDAATKIHIPLNQFRS